MYIMLFLLGGKNMCGIVGIVNYKRDIKEQEKLIFDMFNTLDKRGPDEKGYYMEHHVNLGHRRLSILDIENGKQPMSYKENGNTYTIVYNGQIYNCNELREVLIKKGFEFLGHSDTEILLKSYIHFGKEVVKHLNGIFSFAIWNAQKQELFLARDHFGIKPLYYTIKNGNFIFASEIKAILKHPDVKAEIDGTGISELFGIGPAHSPRKDSIQGYI